MYVCQLFSSNLITRSASAEHAVDADRSVAADVEHTRVRGVPDQEMFDSSECMFLDNTYLSLFI